jgi:predicted nucleic acid-binding protein
MKEHAMPMHTIQLSEAVYRRLSERAARLQPGICTPVAPTANSMREQHGLFMNDSLIVAVMQCERIQVLATNDSDFERVPDIAMYAPRS